MPTLSPTSSTAVAIAHSLLMAALCSLVLHTSADRTEAAWVVPALWVWGAGLFALHPSRPVPWWALGGVALTLRLVLVGTPLLLSDDAYRYLWEGLALNNGYNPFIQAPSSIHGLDDQLQGLVNHPTIPSIYPPLALGWFRLLAHVGTTWFAQLATAIVDASTAVLIWKGTKDPRMAWLYALHPLPVLESASGAHIDVVGISLATAAIIAWRRRRPSMALTLAGLGVLAKLFPIVLLPTMLWHSPPRRSARSLGGLMVLTVLLSLPILGAGSQLFTALSTYTQRWSFNSVLWAWLDPWMGIYTRPTLLLLGVSVSAWTVTHHKDPARVWMWIGSAFLLLSPTVHPWYVLWALVPSLLRRRTDWALASVPLLGSYLVLTGWDTTNQTWHEVPWLWWVTWPPALACWLWGWRADEAQRRSELKPTAP